MTSIALDRPKGVFLHAVSIRAEDIDHMGHVNNAVYLRWVQDAVVDYWTSVAPEGAVAAHLWVATRHEISYLRPALLGDTVVARVVTRSIRGARVFFDTVFERGVDVVASVTSTWCCLDSSTLRPSRLAIDVADRFLPVRVSDGFSREIDRRRAIGA
ncbi:acyl-CoA thioesterase [Sphingomonas sp. GB1N7]|uniref:acyl-CoA thioesterase n=1 Tax=Parasphingomonas caseinilytica TaxID=3096158 RepID=UPI002FCADDC1